MPTMDEILEAQRYHLRRRPPDCEYTNPDGDPDPDTGLVIEGIDCWADATKRHVGPDGHTKQIYCDEHVSFAVLEEGDEIQDLNDPEG